MRGRGRPQNSALLSRNINFSSCKHQRPLLIEKSPAISHLRRFGVINDNSSQSVQREFFSLRARILSLNTEHLLDESLMEDHACAFPVGRINRNAPQDQSHTQDTRRDIPSITSLVCHRMNTTTYLKGRPRQTHAMLGIALPKPIPRKRYVGGLQATHANFALITQR